MAISGGCAVQGIRVLIVEDDALIQLEVEAALHDGGYSTDAESSGESAIGRLENNSDIRAVVTDINLIGEKTGWDVARRAREVFPEIPVMALPSYLTLIARVVISRNQAVISAA